MLLVLLLTTIPPQICSVWGTRANAVSEVWAELGRSSVRGCAAVVLVCASLTCCFVVQLRLGRPQCTH